MAKKTRIEFHEELEKVLGSKNVYFQPLPELKIKYPCIIYERSSGDTQYADNQSYIYRQSYTVTVIAKDPDFEVVDEIPKHFPMCRSNRHFTADNLNHDVFVIYY